MIKIKNYMICRICNKQLNAITNSHLKKHQLTPKQYKLKFGIDTLICDNIREKIGLNGRDNPMFGRKHTEQAKISISIKNKGNISHNKGKTMENYEPLKRSSLKLRGRVFSDESRRKMSKAQLKRFSLSGSKDFYKYKKKLKHSKEFKKYLSICSTGKNNPNWRGGLSFVKYGKDFNKQLKNKIRKKYNNVCINCFKPAKDIHHINYNKKNNNEYNLVLLCKSCHTQTNFYRGHFYLTLRSFMNYFENERKYSIYNNIGDIK